MIDAGDLPGRDPAALITSLEDRIRRLPGHKAKNTAAIAEQPRPDRQDQGRTRQALALPATARRRTRRPRPDRGADQRADQRRHPRPGRSRNRSWHPCRAGSAVPGASPATWTAARTDELSRAGAQSGRLPDERSGEPAASPDAPAASQVPGAREPAPDRAAAQPAADSEAALDPESAASPPASDTTRTGPAPGPATQPAAEEAAHARPATAPAAPLLAPRGTAGPAAPARQPAAASPAMQAPAPAVASSAADQAAAAQAAPAPPAHDPGHPADQDQPGASDPAEGLVIEHHQRGTLVHGTLKNDRPLRRLLHRHGFRWSDRINASYLPRPWAYSTRNRRVSSLTADLRQERRSFTMRTQQAGPASTDDSPSEPLPAADPYTDVRQARHDHSQAVSDYWALTRTPAGNNVMSAYPESGARPDALALNAAYKAVHVSWDQAFAGDPHQVAGRFAAWVQAAAALSRNLAAERHRAPVFRQTLDTFISSATRLASRTQATAQDPGAWARAFAGIPRDAPASGPEPEQAAAPDPAPATDGNPGPSPATPQDEPDRQGSGTPGDAPTVSSAPSPAEPALPDACRSAADLRRLAAACGLDIDTGRPAPRCGTDRGTRQGPHRTAAR